MRRGPAAGSSGAGPRPRLRDGRPPPHPRAQARGRAGALAGRGAGYPRMPDSEAILRAASARRGVGTGATTTIRCASRSSWGKHLGAQLIGVAPGGLEGVASTTRELWGGHRRHEGGHGLTVGFERSGSDGRHRLDEFGEAGPHRVHHGTAARARGRSIDGRRRRGRRPGRPSLRDMQRALEAGVDCGYSSAMRAAERCPAGVAIITSDGSRYGSPRAPI